LNGVHQSAIAPINTTGGIADVSTATGVTNIEELGDDKLWVIGVTPAELQFWYRADTGSNYILQGTLNVSNGNGSV
jgi:hypothetical protein